MAITSGSRRPRDVSGEHCRDRARRMESPGCPVQSAASAAEWPQAHQPGAIRPTGAPSALPSRSWVGSSSAPHGDHDPRRDAGAAPSCSSFRGTDRTRARVRAPSIVRGIQLVAGRSRRERSVRFGSERYVVRLDQIRVVRRVRPPGQHHRDAATSPNAAARAVTVGWSQQRTASTVRPGFLAVIAVLILIILAPNPTFAVSAPRGPATPSRGRAGFARVTGCSRPVVRAGGDASDYAVANGGTPLALRIGTCSCGGSALPAAVKAVSCWDSCLSRRGHA